MSSLVLPSILGGLVLGSTIYLYFGQISVTSGAIIAAAVVGLAWIRKHFDGGSYTGKEEIKGKTVIITGANTGIGKETAKDLARRGGRIFLACRDVGKGEKAVLEIIQETGNHNVFCRKLDLSSFESIRLFAKQFDENEPRLDILLNNAGVMFCPKMLTKDGLEMQIGVNHFGHFLLTNLLIEKLKASAPSRIINVSSRAHRRGTINFEDLNWEKSYSRIYSYGQSKLANILHALELTKRLEGTGVTANSLHPGAVNTELARHTLNRFSRLLLEPVYQLLVKSAVQGAQTSIRLAVDPALETVSGKYFSDCAETKTTPEGQNKDVARRLWEVSEEITKSNYP